MPQKITTQKKLLLASSIGLGLYLLSTKKLPPVIEKAVNAARDLSLPRGLRNNNPLNLRKGVAWSGRNGDDGAFDIFQNMDYGIRAGLQNFKTQHKRGYNTLSKIIARWAPSSDGNKPKEYAAFVAKQVPMSVGEVINLSDKETLSRILYAMAQMENGPEITKKKLSLADFQAVVKLY